MKNKPRLLQTYLVDGTLEGMRVIDPEGDIEAYIIPRLKLAEAKSEPKLAQPALYILLNAEDNRAYIGESENFLTRASQHLAGKDWWTLVVAIVSKNNDLEKGDVKYLNLLPSNVLVMVVSVSRMALFHLAITFNGSRCTNLIKY